MWNDVIQNNNKILDSIDEYNKRIINGGHLDQSGVLEKSIYLDILCAHIILYLIEDNDLYISQSNIKALMINDANVFNFVIWQCVGDHQKVGVISDSDKDMLISQLVKHCFNEKSKSFIQEVCAQDIVYGGTLAKDISSFLGTVAFTIEIDVKGEEYVFDRLAKMRNIGEPFRNYTQIENKFGYEYQNRGALIRNRVFRHNSTSNSLSVDIVIPTESAEFIDYRIDKNFCQAALLHIGVEKTGNSGTGFVISEDGYALTCAHVVEGAKEVYATVINGDGYQSTFGNEGFEVYDAGEGEVIYINKELDIALLKMRHFGSGILPIEQKPILPELGEEVVVFGYPLGYEMPQSNFFGPNISFYKGYISSNQIDNGNSVTFLDIDVKSGNSGSPVISVKTGKVIGIMSGIKLGGRRALTEKMPYMIPIQHFIELNSK